MSQNGLPIVDFLSHLFLFRQWGKKQISKKKICQQPQCDKDKRLLSQSIPFRDWITFCWQKSSRLEKIVVSLAQLAFQTRICFTGGCVCRCKDIDCLLVDSVCIKRKLMWLNSELSVVYALLPRVRFLGVLLLFVLRHFSCPIFLRSQYRPCGEAQLISLR